MAISQHTHAKTHAHVQPHNVYRFCISVHVTKRVFLRKIAQGFDTQANMGSVIASVTKNADILRRKSLDDETFIRSGNRYGQRVETPQGSLRDFVVDMKFCVQARIVNGLVKTASVLEGY